MRARTDSNIFPEFYTKQSPSGPAPNKESKIGDNQMQKTKALRDPEWRDQRKKKVQEYVVAN